MDAASSCSLVLLVAAKTSSDLAIPRYFVYFASGVWLASFVAGRFERSKNRRFSLILRETTKNQ